MFQYDYYVKRWRKGGYYAVCFSSITKANIDQIIENVNKELGLEDENGTTYSVREIEIPTGVENEYDYTSVLIDQEDCEHKKTTTLYVTGTNESFSVCEDCGKEV